MKFSNYSKIELIIKTYLNPMIPVLDMTYAKPRIPLPMIAFIKLNTEKPKEVPVDT